METWNEKVLRDSRLRCSLPAAPTGIDLSTRLTRDGCVNGVFRALTSWKDENGNHRDGVNGIHVSVQEHVA